MAAGQYFGSPARVFDDGAGLELTGVWRVHFAWIGNFWVYGGGGLISE
jgi:hypothetical protein